MLESKLCSKMGRKVYIVQLLEIDVEKGQTAFDKESWLNIFFTFKKVGNNGDGEGLT